ncbi:la-related protein 7, partial [Asbolus verrucosus]
MESETTEHENPNDEQIHKKGRHHVDLNVFLKFNKIRKLTCNIEDIQKAIKKSKLIELSEDKSSVCRKEPVKEKTNVDECTIYVERIKTDATHEWITSVFSEFGNVVYVSIPKYKHNNAVKGFAFVEFNNENEAQNALNYFESIGCKMPSNVEPEELCSIATFEGNEKYPTSNTKNLSKKRKISEIEDVKDNEEKKHKLETGEVSESDDTENKKKKKLKKEHKKKNYIKELGLQVLSKKEWKKMRNRYLDLQKKKMHEFKRHLLKARFSQANYDDKFKKPNENPEQRKTEKMLSKLEFVEGVINELKLSCSDIKYVDIPNPGSEDVYVRFNTSNGAKSFCNQEVAGKKVILEGDEENSYWDRILQNREDKFKKQNKKQRGRDKLLKK